MKNNAITRIIIWSIVILVLTAAMCTILFGMVKPRFLWKLTNETALTEPLELPVLFGTVTDNTQVYSSPNESASKLSLLSAGTEVTIETRETVDDENWGYITSPASGWVRLNKIRVHHEYRNSTEEVILTTQAPDADSGERTSFSASEVKEIEIDWVAGDILIQPHDGDTITFFEDGNFDQKFAMVWQCRGGALKIQFCEEGLNIGINNTNNLSKDLTVYVPRDWECESLELDVASAKVEINDMVIREVDFDGASGTCEFDNCTVNELDIDTASGDIRFVGNLDILDCDAFSASVYAVLSNTPSRLDLDSMSGDLDITLPADAGFTLSMNAMSSDFSSDFETSMKNGNYVCGDGRCRINVDGMSGDVAIRKAESMITPAATDAVTSP